MPNFSGIDTIEKVEAYLGVGGARLGMCHKLSFFVHLGCQCSRQIPAKEIMS
jgi:hypothetical protein